MVDIEVKRLRSLRGSALQLRAVARALDGNKWTRDDGLLDRGRCAAWRVARTVTGRLRAHPNDRFQKDAGVATVVKNGIVAAATSLTASSRRHAMRGYGAQLKAVMRELDDARALTWAADLSDAFGRSQAELRALFDEVHCELHECSGRSLVPRDRHPATSVNGDSPFLTM